MIITNAKFISGLVVLLVLIGFVGELAYAAPANEGYGSDTLSVTLSKMDGKGRNEDSRAGIGGWCTYHSDMYTKIKIQDITMETTPVFKNNEGSVNLDPVVTATGNIPRNSMKLTFDMKDKDADLCGDDDDMGEYSIYSLPAINTWIPSNADKNTGAYYLTAATIQDNGVDAPTATGPSGNIYDYLWNSVSTFTWNVVGDRSGIDGYWVEISYNNAVVHDSGKLTCTANPCVYAVSVNESFLVHNQEYTWRVVVKDNYASRNHVNSTSDKFKFIDDDVVAPNITSTLAPTTIYDGDNSFFVTVEATDPVNGDDRGVSETYATHKGTRFNSDFYSSIGPKITSYPHSTSLLNPTISTSIIDEVGEDTESYYVQNGIFYTSLKDDNPDTEATEGEHDFNYYATGSFTIPTLTTTNLGYGGRTFGEKTLKSVDVNVSYSLYHDCDGWFRLFGEEILCSVEACIFGECIGSMGNNYIKAYYSLDGGSTYTLGNSVSRGRTNEGTSTGTFTFNVPNVNEGSTIMVKVEHSGSTKPVWETKTYKSSQVSVEVIRTYNWTIASQSLIEITNPVKLISSNNAYDVFAVDNDTDRANDMLTAQKTLYYSVVDDDETDPTVFLLTPSVRTIIGKSSLPFTFTASADDESEIASVEFKVGTTSIGVDSSYDDGWAVSWNGGIVDGEYAVTAIAIDNDTDRPGDQRSATSASVNIVLDTIDPTAPTLIAPAYSNTGNVMLSWSGASDANGIFKYVIMRRCTQSLRFADEYDPVFKKIGEVGGNKNTYTDTGRLDAATYEYKLVVYDNAENSAESNSASTTIDTENPGVTIVSPATDSILNTNSVLIKANYLNLNNVTCEVNDNGGIYYDMAGDGFVSGVATYTFAGLTEGTHIFNVNCTDVASNSNTSVTGVFVDTQAPAASITLGMPENGWVNTDSIVFNPVCTDPSPSSGIASCETFVKFGSGFFTRVSTTQGEQTQSLNSGDGTYTFKVVAKDNAGNSAESMVEVKKDTQSPSASLIVTPNSYTNKDLATFNANCWDVAKDGINSGINTCKVCLTSPSGYECFGRTGTVEMIADGAYIFSVIATDNAGNSFTLEPTDATTALVDTVPPVTEAIAPSEWVNHDVTVVFFARDDINSTIVSGIKETRACTSLSDCVPYLVSGSLLVTSEGNNLVKYYSIDNANNSESIKTSFVRIDKTAPIVNIVVNGTYSMCADGYYADSVKVLAAAYDPGSASGMDGLYYMLDNGGSWISYPENGVIVTKQGMTVVSFKAVDKAGNEKVESVDLYVDKDSDADSVYDNCDQCPTTSCSLCGFDSAKCALFKGCPAAIKADAVTQGFEVVVDNKGKTKSQPVKHPIENLFVRVYSKGSGSCATQFGGTSWQNYDNIIANCEPDSYCITDTTGTCIAGVEKGEYIAIGNLLAQEVNGTIELMGEQVQIGDYVYILNDIKHLGSPTDYLNCGEMPIKNLKQQDIPDTNPGRQSKGLLDPIGKVLEIFVNPLEREFATAVGVVGIISITFYVLFSIVERRIKGDKN